MTSLANLSSDTENGALHIQINDSLDALAVGILRPKFDGLVQDQHNVVIDIRNVNFNDSSGIGAIVFLFKRLRALGKSLSIIGAHGQPLEIMRHLRVDKTITVVES